MSWWLLGFWLIDTALALWALYAMYRETHFSGGSEHVAWVLLILFVPIVGPVAYLLSHPRRAGAHG